MDFAKLFHSEKNTEIPSQILVKYKKLTSDDRATGPNIYCIWCTRGYNCDIGSDGAFHGIKIGQVSLYIFSFI